MMFFMKSNSQCSSDDARPKESQAFFPLQTAPGRRENDFGHIDSNGTR